MEFFERFKESVDSRVIRPWMEKNYSKTKYGKRITKLKNKYVDKRCFFIGNGPSLRAEDLTTLQRNKEITFAFNRIYNIFEETNWRPTFYISQDEKMLKGCADLVNNMHLPYKFIPIQLRWYYDINIHDAIYFNMNWQKEEDPSYFLFSKECNNNIYCASTVMYTAAQMAAYMGFSEIYLLGVDHHFHISINNSGEIMVDDNTKDYFCDNYNMDKQDLYIPNTERSTLTYYAMKRHCERLGITVFNATRGGKLEVFLRKDFDSLFTNQRVN